MLCFRFIESWNVIRRSDNEMERDQVKRAMAPINCSGQMLEPGPFFDERRWYCMFEIIEFSEIGQFDRNVWFSKVLCFYFRFWMHQKNLNINFIYFPIRRRCQVSFIAATTENHQNNEYLNLKWKNALFFSKACVEIQISMFLWCFCFCIRFSSSIS